MHSSIISRCSDLDTEAFGSCKSSEPVVSRAPILSSRFRVSAGFLRIVLFLYHLHYASVGALPLSFNPILLDA